MRVQVSEFLRAARVIAAAAGRSVSALIADRLETSVLMYAHDAAERAKHLVDKSVA
jgi:hypothetical protein